MMHTSAASTAPRVEQALDAALARIATVAPMQVARAQRELASTLAATHASALGQAAWWASALTPARFPVEIALTSATDELRTVVDVIAPEHDRATALPIAVELAQDQGSMGPDPALLHELLRHQQSFAPRFGAWLGSRHECHRTRHKLYVEVAPDASDAWALIDEVTPRVRTLAGGLGRLRFIGLALDGSDRIEAYLRPSVVDGYDLLALLGRCGLDHLAADMIADLGGADDRHPQRRLASRNLALSLAVDGDDVRAVAGFTFAHHRYGRDHHARARVLARAQADGWPSTAMYEQLSEPSAAPVPLHRPWHGALSSVAVAGASTLERHVGMAPPLASRTSRPTHEQGVLP